LTQYSDVQTRPRAIKISSTPSFRGEVKPGPDVIRFLAMLKIPSKYEQKYFTRPNSTFSSFVPPACYQMTADRITRGLWLTKQDFSSVDRISIMVLHTHISPGDRSSETLILFFASPSSPSAKCMKAVICK
jgi:hypothetical protein